MVCACDLTVHLDVISIGFAHVCVCRKLAPRLRAGSLVFALLILLCAILHTIWLGKRLPLLYILPFCILCLPATRMMFVKIILAVCMLVGMVSQRSGPFVFCKLCLFCAEMFVRLQSISMSYFNCDMMIVRVELSTMSVYTVC